MNPLIRLVRCNVKGHPVGEDACAARFSDAAVTKAKELRAAGWTLSQIATELGCNFRTVSDWCLGKRRRPHVRVIARRIDPASFKVNHERPTEIDSQANRHAKGAGNPGADTVRSTDFDRK